MILLFDIGNTNTHVGLANSKRVVRHADIPTAAWLAGIGMKELRSFVSKTKLEGAAICSVVPRVYTKNSSDGSRFVEAADDRAYASNFAWCRD